MKLGDNNIVQADVISSGSLGLDLALDWRYSQRVEL